MNKHPPLSTSESPSGSISGSCERSRCNTIAYRIFKGLLVLVPLTLTVLAIVQVAKIESTARKTLKTPEEWKALMKSHPFERNPSFARSPCPMLNTLANHGFLPRNGRDITRQHMVDVVTMLGASPIASTLFLYTAYISFHQVDPADPFLAVFMPAPVIHLDRLTIHNYLEHDVSLTRLDIHIPPHDAVHPDGDLVSRMVRLGLKRDTGLFTMQDEHDTRRVRWIESARDNPLSILGFFQQFASAAECTLLMDIIGRDGVLRADHLESILYQERLPDDWYPSPKSIPLSSILLHIFQCWSGVRNSRATPESMNEQLSLP